jgi:hypothetical protein
VRRRWCCPGFVDCGSELLRTAYGDLCGLAVGLTEADSWQPSGCAGWAVRDLLLHHLGDAQRALVALATASPDGPCDRDAVTYWTDAPGRSDPESRGLRATRTIASAYRLDALQTVYLETLQAVVALASRVAPSAVAVTQSHVLRVDDTSTSSRTWPRPVQQLRRSPLCGAPLTAYSDIRGRRTGTTSPGPWSARAVSCLALANAPRWVRTRIASRCSLDVDAAGSYSCLVRCRTSSWAVSR